MKKNLNGQLYRIVDELVCRGVTLQQARREFERQFIVATLRSNDGNISRAARELGVHRNTLRNKVSNLGIDPSDIPGRSRGRGSQSRHS
jgi:DNA-binding NtrC family response regulator